MITFEVDFSGSRNLEFYQDSTKVDKDQTVFKKRIEPLKPTKKNPHLEWQTNLICKVKLLDGWKMKSKFKFSLANPSREIQKQYIVADKERHKQELQLFEKYIKMPLQLMTVKEISDLIYRNVDKFYDLEFPPNWRSIFDGQLNNPLDIHVHWRRPSEYLQTVI